MIRDNYMIPVIHFEDIVMSYAKGSYIYDTENNKYLDLNSGQFCTILGHSNEYISQAIIDSSKKLTHTSTAILSEDVIKASKKIHEISKDMKAYSIFLSTGSEGIEFAIRYAKYIKNKDGIICFDKGYHGLSLGSQSITYSGVFARPQVDNIYTIKSDIKTDNVDELTQILENNDDISALVVEPIVSVGGMIFPSSSWFKKARKVCDKYGILLIFDECQTGFGRTGEWFAYQMYGVIPDMVVTAKGIGQGYPVSLVMFRDILINKDFSMTHYSSHQNDSFASVIINAGIDYIQNNNVLNDIKIKGEYFKSKLQQLTNKTTKLKNVRGLGLMLGCDINLEGVTDYRQTYRHLSNAMMKQGVLIQGTNGGETIRFLPDFLISKEDIDFAIRTLESVLQQF